MHLSLLSCYKYIFLCHRLQIVAPLLSACHLKRREEFLLTVVPMIKMLCVEMPTQVSIASHCPKHGPTAIHMVRVFTNSEQRKLFKNAKRLQLKRTRYKHHESNYIYCYDHKIIPKGLLIKCRPSIDSQTRGLVSKETVVLRRWGRETQNFGFID